MKLFLRVLGDVIPTQVPEQIDIKNSRATVANLRAAIAVNLRVEPDQFTLAVGDRVLNESDTLGAAGLVEGATVEITMRAATRSAQLAPAPTGAPRAENFAGAEPVPRSRARTAALSALLQRAMANENIDSYSDDDEDFEEVDDVNSDGDDDDGDEDDDDDDEDDDDDDAEDPPEVQEQSEIAVALLQLPSWESLKQRFDDDPRAAMMDIQSINPDLFALIAKHPQFFLDFLRAGGDDGGGVSSSSSSSTTSRVQPAPNDAVEPLTDEDQRNIESLMQMGFTREQCVAAYLRCGKSVDRAALSLVDA